jgi:hypothetical protein
MKVQLSSGSFVETSGPRARARVARGIAALLTAPFWLFGLGAPRSADAHALLIAPSPRDQSDAHKDPTGPCGVTRSTTEPVRQLTPGASFNVMWNETVNHPGCFVIDFSAAGDANFQVLATVAHNTSAPTPRPYAQMVTLPAAPCAACTLRVRQIMLSAEPAAGAACPPATLPTGSTYYTCANVVLGTGAVDPGSPDAGVADASAERAGDGAARGGTGGSTGMLGTGGASGPGAPAGTGGAIATGGVAASTGGTGGATSAGAPTGSGGAASGGATGSSAIGADQTAGCACSTVTSKQSSMWTTMALSTVFVLLWLRRRNRRKYKQPNLSLNPLRRIR